MTTKHKLNVLIEIEIEGKGAVRGELKRYLAPMTFDELIRKLPIDGVASIKENILQINIKAQMIRGSEKPATKINRGDILYWPFDNSLLIPLENNVSRAQSVKIGNIRGDISLLSNINQGVKVTIRAIE